MKLLLRSCLGCGLFVAAIGLGAAAVAAEPYQPTVGQDGKDVIWVPTPDTMVDKMLDVAGVTPRDFVMDLGSGDGRNVIGAARRGARGVGIDLNYNLIEFADANAIAERVVDQVKFVHQDLFTMDLSPATVVTLYLLPALNLRLRPKLSR